MKTGNEIFFKHKSSDRIIFYDTLRGLAIIYVVLFHTAFDLYYVFGIDSALLRLVGHPAVLIINAAVASVFIMLSGICTNYSRNPLRRGLIILIFGLLISVATMIVVPSLRVRFGILTLIGVSMTLVALLKKPLGHIPPPVGIAASAVLYAAAYALFPIDVSVSFLYSLGLTAPGFFSADYYPLLPYFFAYLCGAFLGRLLISSKTDLKLKRVGAAPLSFLGRNSIYIYLLHQPVVFGILWLLIR